MKTALLLITSALLMAAITSCANMGPNDGLVPMAGAQADLPYIPASSPVSARLGAPMGAGAGVAVSPLAQKSQSFWQ